MALSCVDIARITQADRLIAMPAEVEAAPSRKETPSASEEAAATSQEAATASEEAAAASQEAAAASEEATAPGEPSIHLSIVSIAHAHCCKHTLWERCMLPAPTARLIHTYAAAEFMQPGRMA